MGAQVALLAIGAPGSHASQGLPVVSLAPDKNKAHVLVLLLVEEILTLSSACLKHANSSVHLVVSK